MERLRGFPRRFRFPWRSSAQIRRDVDNELAFHLAAKVEALQRDGLGVEEAREEALRQFGDLEGARERLVEDDRRGEERSLRLAMLDDLGRDLRIACRSLRRTPGFTVVAVLVLALGIGVVSAAFGLVNVLALKPVLIEEPEQLLGVFSEHSENPSLHRSFSYPEYVQIRERSEAFSSLAAHNVDFAGVGEGDGARRVMTAFVSANYFETLGVPLAQGRGFTAAEERGDDPPTVVVSHDFWVRQGADPNLLGSTLRVNGEPLTVVGIAARGFTGTTALLSPQVWVPLAFEERMRVSEDGEPVSLRDARYRSLLLFGRLRDGASAAEAQSELAALASRIDANLPASDGAPFTYVVAPMARLSISTEPDEGIPLLGPAVMLTAMSTVVLLIACLNLANMFLARGASRRTEMAIRQSLGSGRARLVRQLLTEGLLLAALGGAVGLIWAYWGIGWVAASFARIFPFGLTIVLDTRPDVRVLLVTAATCVAATLLFGLAPAWRVTGTDISSGLREGAGRISFGRKKARAMPSGRNLTIVAQIALSLVMLTAGGLFLRSALVAAEATPGFSLDSSVLVELDPSLVGYGETRSRALYSQVFERLRALPEVESAGMASLVPFGPTTNMRGVQRAGLAPGESVSTAHFYVVSDDYFDALRLPILRGRDFTPAEAASDSGARVAIIDRALARSLFPDDDALGRHVQFAFRSPGAQPIVMEIVGIAPGTRHRLTDTAPSPHVYVPFGQAYSPNMNVHLAVGERAGDEAALLATIRNEIREIDPALPVLTLTTMCAFRDENATLWAIRTGGQLFTLLGAAALFMALIGLYGVKAYLTSRRTREIGVRMALGATRGDVLRQMMRESLALTAAGIVVGVLLALAAARLLGSVLYAVSATDPAVFAGAAAFLAVAATFASWLPIRKALRVQPSAALRHE